MAFMDYLFGEGQRTEPSRARKGLESLAGTLPEQVSSLGSFFGGEPARTERKPIYTPEQEQLLGMARQGALTGMPAALQNIHNILGGDPEQLKAFEAPARRSFREETVPSIAHRFASMGEGSLMSSAYGQAQLKAAERLEEKLFAERLNRQERALQSLMGFGQLGLKPLEYEFLRPRQPGGLEKGAALIGPILQAIAAFV